MSYCSSLCAYEKRSEVEDPPQSDVWKEVEKERVSKTHSAMVVMVMVVMICGTRCLTDLPGRYIDRMRRGVT